jgi:hypothetical protein
MVFTIQPTCCAEHTRQYGAAVISKVRNKNPTAYFRILASILPRDVPTPIQKNEFDHLTDEELGADLIRTVGLLLGEEQLEQLLRKNSKAPVSQLELGRAK